MNNNFYCVFLSNCANGNIAIWWPLFCTGTFGYTRLTVGYEGTVRAGDVLSFTQKPAKVSPSSLDSSDKKTTFLPLDHGVYVVSNNFIRFVVLDIDSGFGTSPRLGVSLIQSQEKHSRFLILEMIESQILTRT